MSDLYDYLIWRGDISFSEVGMREADYVVFCALAYLPFDGLVSERPGEEAELGEVLSRMKEIAAEKTGPKQKRRKKKPENEYLNKNRERLAALAADCPRFGSLKISGFVNRIDTGMQKQFSAMTFRLPTGDIVVTFRGTDNTIVGWKEDFNMGFMSELPSQKDAIEYLKESASAYKRVGIYVCGHSKGGNLAMYSSFFCPERIQRRIVCVRNLDGPGFIEEVLEKEGPKGIIGRTKTYVPQSSVVGMLLTHEEPYHVVHSTNTALMQHALESWEIRGGGLVEDGAITDSSQILDRTLKQWVLEMSIEQRGKLIDSIYEVVSKADASTVRELANSKNTLLMLKAVSRLDDEKKLLIRTAYRIFMRSLKQSWSGNRFFGPAEKETADAGRILEKE